MENSNTLPKIEVGDTVIFRTDLIEDEFYGDIQFFLEKKDALSETPIVCHIDTDDNTFKIVDNEFWYSFEMVSQVIKPTKERVYTEQEMRKAIEMARVGNKSFWGYTADAIIESLNK